MGFGGGGGSPELEHSHAHGTADWGHTGRQQLLSAPSMLRAKGRPKESLAALILAAESSAALLGTGGAPFNPHWCFG